MKHSHFERRQLGVEEDEEDGGESPHVRRKLFSIQAAAEPEEEAEVAIQKKKDKKMKLNDFFQRWRSKCLSG